MISIDLSISLSLKIWSEYNEILLEYIITTIIILSRITTYQPFFTVFISTVNDRYYFECNMYYWYLAKKEH